MELGLDLGDRGSVSYLYNGHVSVSLIFGHHAMLS